MATSKALSSLTGQELLKKVRNEQRLNSLLFLLSTIFIILFSGVGYNLGSYLGFIIVFIAGVTLCGLIFEKNIRWMRNFNKFIREIMAVRGGKMFKANLEEGNEAGYKEFILEKIEEYSLFPHEKI